MVTDSGTKAEAVLSNCARTESTPYYVRSRPLTRLLGLQSAFWSYRLRLRDYRVFYNVDVVKRRVNVLEILYKEQTRKYYEEVTK